jgi:peptidoglycan/xylan/chitin deacetylase (PgdA/CDA1 family)
MAVTQDVERNFESSRRLAERLREMSAPVTFFVVSQLALENPGLAAPLGRVGEIGSHTVDHQRLAGRPLLRQFGSLRRSRDDIERWVGRPPVGLRPPAEVFDSLTLEAWARLGGLYVAATNGARTAVPAVHTVKAGPVVVLPRVVDDDYAVVVLRGRDSPDSLHAALSAGLTKMRGLGGLQLVTLHSQLIRTGAWADTVAAVVRAARAAGDVWVTRAETIARWWLARSQVDVEAAEREDGSVRLTVRNRGSEAVTPLALRIYLPEASRYSAPEVGEATLPADYRPWGMRVIITRLGPGQELPILIPRALQLSGDP